MENRTQKHANSHLLRALFPAAPSEPAAPAPPSPTAAAGEFVKQRELDKLVALLEGGQYAEALELSKRVQRNSQACTEPNCDCSGAIHCPVYAPGIYHMLNRDKP